MIRAAPDILRRGRGDRSHRSARLAFLFLALLGPTLAFPALERRAFGNDGGSSPPSSSGSWYGSASPSHYTTSSYHPSSASESSASSLAEVAGPSHQGHDSYDRAHRGGAPPFEASWFGRGRRRGTLPPTRDAMPASSSRPPPSSSPPPVPTAPPSPSSSSVPLGIPPQRFHSITPKSKQILRDFEAMHNTLSRWDSQEAVPEHVSQNYFAVKREASKVLVNMRVREKFARGSQLQIPHIPPLPGSVKPPSAGRPRLRRDVPPQLLPPSSPSAAAAASESASASAPPPFGLPAARWNGISKKSRQTVLQFAAMHHELSRPESQAAVPKHVADNYFGTKKLVNKVFVNMRVREAKAGGRRSSIPPLPPAPASVQASRRENLKGKMRESRWDTVQRYRDQHKLWLEGREGVEKLTTSQRRVYDIANKVGFIKQDFLKLWNSNPRTEKARQRPWPIERQSMALAGKAAAAAASTSASPTTRPPSPGEPHSPATYEAHAPMPHPVLDRPPGHAIFKKKRNPRVPLPPRPTGSGAASSGESVSA